MWTLWVWLSLGREDFHGEVSYILAAFGVSQEDGLLFCLRGADVPVGVQGRLEFNSVLDFCLVEDESLFHVLLGNFWGLHPAAKQKYTFVARDRSKIPYSDLGKDVLQVSWR